MLELPLEEYFTDPCKLVNELIDKVVVVFEGVVTVISPVAEIENVFLEVLQLELQTSFVKVFALQSHIPRYLVPPLLPQVVYQDSVVLTQFPEVSVVSGHVETSFVEQSSELSD